MSTSEETPAAPAALGFAALGVAPELVSTLTALGYEEPTPIQGQAIPPFLEGRDVLGQAGTGTGKTAAFALPLLQRLPKDEPKKGCPQAIVLVPTRELAMQVAEAIHKYGREKKVSVLPIYGGQSMIQQLRVLDRGVRIVVATPGRALDHLTRGSLDLSAVKTIVLDEADEMLDMGFAEDIDAIFEKTPRDRQTALFSATLPPRILSIANRHLKNPVTISIAREKTKAGEAPRVSHVVYIVPRAHKHTALGRVLDMEAPTSAIVFCRTRIEVDELTEAMNGRGFRAEALHGGFAQEQRDRVMKRFRGGQSELLIATDVAARGLDIEHISHVVNYDVPSEPDIYIHRIGRTGRAGREGVAITFVEPREHRMVKNIQNLMQQKIVVATIPTVADLRQRRLELTRTALREAIVAGNLDVFRSAIAELASEFDPMDVAAAAMKLAHEASHEESEAQKDEQDVPLQEFAHHPGPPDGDRSRPRDFGGKSFRKKPEWETARIFIGAGRNEGLRPGDLVGAIANESGLVGKEIGILEIADRFAIVEVPAAKAEDVIRALKRTKLRGKQPTIRFDRGPAYPPSRAPGRSLPPGDKKGGGGLEPAPRPKFSSKKRFKSE